MIFCRLPIMSILSCITRTYKNYGFGCQWYLEDRGGLCVLGSCHGLWSHHGMCRGYAMSTDRASEASLTRSEHCLGSGFDEGCEPSEAYAGD